MTEQCHEMEGILPGVNPRPPEEDTESHLPRNRPPKQRPASDVAARTLRKAALPKENDL